MQWLLTRSTHNVFVDDDNLVFYISFDCVRFNDTSTLVGHFVSSRREKEKRDRRDR